MGRRGGKPATNRLSYGKARTRLGCCNTKYTDGDSNITEKKNGMEHTTIERAFQACLTSIPHFKSKFEWNSGKWLVASSHWGLVRIALTA
jgi:hypothetical protein